ncbi:MAG: TonB family protein [Myxococcota bacterium]|nr:TonB family protein [Myxococcota bacterium]
MTLSTPLRAGWWIASLAAHGVVWMASGHAARESPEPQSAVGAEVAVDVAPDNPVLAQESPGGDAPTARRPAASVVLPAPHAHAYPVRPDHDAHPHDPSIVHVPFGGPPLPDLPPAAVPVHFAMTVIGSLEQRVPEMEIATAAPGGGSGALRREEAHARPALESDVSLPARLASPLAPVYPPAAREEGAEADVALAIVVSATGTVAEATVATDAKRTLAWGFEDAALRALRNARFRPAQRDGKPVAVRMRWTVSFRLR